MERQNDRPHRHGGSEQDAMDAATRGRPEQGADNPSKPSQAEGSREAVDVALRRR